MMTEVSYSTPQRTMRDVVEERVREALERGHGTAAQAWERLKEQGKMLEDFLVPIGGHNGRAYFTGADAGSPSDTAIRMVACTEKGEDLFVRTFHPNGMKQLGDKFGIPPMWLRDMAFGEDWMRSASRGLLNKFAANGETRTVLVRAVGDDIRAVLSDRYKRMDTLPIFSSFLTGAYGNGAVPYNGAVTDLRANMEVLKPEVVEVPLPDGKAVHIVFGAHISSSDFGSGSLQVRGFYLQGACLNGMVRKNVMREVHLGRRMELADMMSDETMRKDTEATRSAVGDIVRHVLSPAYIEQTKTLIQTAAGMEVDVHKEVQALGKMGLLKGEIEEVDAIIANGKFDDGVDLGPCAWKVVAGITAMARDKEADRQRELQMIASDWLDKTLKGIESKFEKELQTA